jgi:D-tyrosyl-tRNA(Tyr) deacylase
MVESGGQEADPAAGARPPAAAAPETRVTGEIGPGFCVLLSVGPGDTEATADRLAERVARLRICADPAGKMNLDLHQTGGEVLVVSQFTLHADASGGHRPLRAVRRDPGGPRTARRVWRIRRHDAGRAGQ